MRKLTRDEWIVKAIERHGDGKYDYSLVELSGSNRKIKIRCLECGNVFEQRADSHILGNGCANCHHLSQTFSREEFLSIAIKKHGDGRYDYSLSKYSGKRSRIDIICNQCGLLFSQLAGNHLHDGAGCPSCAKKSMSGDTEWFISCSIEVHGKGKFDYSAVSYGNNNRDKVTITCNSCKHSFSQTPSDHLSGRGCPKCSGKLPISTSLFIEKASKKHGDGKYDYSLVSCNRATDAVSIKCNTCERLFDQRVSDHLFGKGCPFCKKSHGESLIASILGGMHINYVYQKRFKGCKHKKPLPFDFYLPDHNVCIEYQGQLHYIDVEYFGGKKALKSCQRRDKIKAKFCKDNGMHLEVIPHWLDESQVRAIIARLAHIQLSLF